MSWVNQSPFWGLLKLEVGNRNSFFLRDRVWVDVWAELLGHGSGDPGGHATYHTEIKFADGREESQHREQQRHEIEKENPERMIVPGSTHCQGQDLPFLVVQMVSFAFVNLSWDFVTYNWKP